MAETGWLDGKNDPILATPQAGLNYSGLNNSLKRTGIKSPNTLYKGELEGFGPGKI